MTSGPRVDSSSRGKGRRSATWGAKQPAPPPSRSSSEPARSPGHTAARGSGRIRVQHRRSRARSSRSAHVRAVVRNPKRGPMPSLSVAPTMSGPTGSCTTIVGAASQADGRQQGKPAEDVGELLRRFGAKNRRSLPYHVGAATGVTRRNEQARNPCIRRGPGCAGATSANGPKRA